jgi:hypothetical protein
VIWSAKFRTFRLPVGRPNDRRGGLGSADASSCQGCRRVQSLLIVIPNTASARPPVSCHTCATVSIMVRYHLRLLRCNISLTLRNDCNLLGGTTLRWLMAAATSGLRNVRILGKTSGLRPDRFGEPRGRKRTFVHRFAAKPPVHLQVRLLRRCLSPVSISR